MICNPLKIWLNYIKTKTSITWLKTLIASFCFYFAFKLICTELQHVWELLVALTPKMLVAIVLPRFMSIFFDSCALVAIQSSFSSSHVFIQTWHFVFTKLMAGFIKNITLLGSFASEPFQAWNMYRFGIQTCDAIACLLVSRLLMTEMQLLYMFLFGIPLFLSFAIPFALFLCLLIVGILLAFLLIRIKKKILSQKSFFSNLTQITIFQRSSWKRHHAKTKELDKTLTFLLFNNKTKRLAYIFFFISNFFSPLELFIFASMLELDIRLEQAVFIDCGLTIVRNAFGFIPWGIGIQEFGSLTLFQMAFPNENTQTHALAFSVMRRIRELFYFFIGMVFFLKNCRLRKIHTVQLKN